MVPFQKKNDPFIHSQLYTTTLQHLFQAKEDVFYTSFCGVFNNPLNRPLNQCSTNSRKTPTLYILCVPAKLGIKPEKDHTPPSLLGFHPILHYFDVRLMFNCFFRDNLMDMFFGLNPGE